jgi:hypothetical protein
VRGVGARVFSQPPPNSTKGRYVGAVAVDVLAEIDIERPRDEVAAYVK